MPSSRGRGRIAVQSWCQLRIAWQIVDHSTCAQGTASLPCAGKGAVTSPCCQAWRSGDGQPDRGAALANNAASNLMCKRLYDTLVLTRQRGMQGAHVVVLLPWLPEHSGMSNFVDKLLLHAPLTRSPVSLPTRYLRVGVKGCTVHTSRILGSGVSLHSAQAQPRRELLCPAPRSLQRVGLAMLAACWPRHASQMGLSCELYIR